MICSIHQPNFLPWEGYFHKIKHSDVFVILDNVDIVLGSNTAITNRTKIKTPNGEQWITVPLKKSDSKLISEQIILSGTWKTKMLKSIEYNYRRSRCFDLYFDQIKEIILFDSIDLTTYNEFGIKKICEILNIETSIYRASQLPALSNERNMRIIDICKYFNANTYYSGNGGKKYHNEKLFEDHGVSIKYTNFKSSTYPQLYDSFIPGMSVIDHLFNEHFLIQ